MFDDDFDSIDVPPVTGVWQFWKSLRRTARRVGPWLTIGLLLWATALTLSLPTYAWFENVVANRYPEGATTFFTDVDFRTDHAEGLRNLSDSQRASLAFFQVIAVLGGVFAAGGWLQVTLERRQGSDLRRFLFGGGRYWWRFFRVFLLAATILVAWNWVLYGYPWETYVLEGWKEMPAHTLNRDSAAFAETLGSELEKHQLVWLQDGLFAGIFALTLAWGIYTRSRLALLDDRSVVWAGACALCMMVRHPLKTLRPLVLLFLFEFVVVTVVMGFATGKLDVTLENEPARGVILAMGAIGLLAVLFREILRGSQYHAAIKVSQELIKPTLRPDPWQTIGGPGGPQYPVDDEHGERYGVSL